MFLAAFRCPLGNASYVLLLWVSFIVRASAHALVIDVGSYHVGIQIGPSAPYFKLT